LPHCCAESARTLFEQVVKDLTDFVATLTEAELEQNANDVPASRWQVLRHMVNHSMTTAPPFCKYSMKLMRRPSVRIIFCGCGKNNKKAKWKSVKRSL